MRSWRWRRHGVALLLDRRAAVHGSRRSKVVFQAFEPSTGTELWETDGTPAGTKLLVDIVPGSAGSGPTQLRHMAEQGLLLGRRRHHRPRALGHRRHRSQHAFGRRPEPGQGRLTAALAARQRERHLLRRDPDLDDRIRALPLRRHRRRDEARQGPMAGDRQQRASKCSSCRRQRASRRACVRATESGCSSKRDRRGDPQRRLHGAIVFWSMSRP